MTDYNDSGQESTDPEPTTDEHRAEWERFSMTVLGGDGGGYVNVRNDSYDDTNDHIYSVHVENGRADGCSCPHATYRDAHCKHQVAVENRPLVVSSATASAATTGRQVATDGGAVMETDEDGTTGEDDHSRPQTDIWGNPVEHYDDEVRGAGEKRECQSCGSQFEVSLVAATADSTRRNWEEFYECQNCGAMGSFRFEDREHREARRTWTGEMDYPEETR